MKIDTPQFIFIAGAPRSSNNTINALLDNHPDILSWPSECHYFTIFKSVAGTNSKASVHDLNKAFVEHFTNRLMERLEFHSVDKTYKEKNITRQLGEFNLDTFTKLLNSKSKTQTMTKTEHLRFIFESFHKSHYGYANKKVKYYSMMCTARGFDWNDEDLIASNQIIYPFRPHLDSYASLRDVYFNSVTLNEFFDCRNPKGFLYWLNTYTQISKHLKLNMNRNNFNVLSVAQLRLDPQKTISSICSFLEIPFTSEVTHMTMLGKPYGGNAREKSLSTSKVATRPSKLLHPLIDFETKIFETLHLFDFDEQSYNQKKDGFVTLLISAFRTSFFQITLSVFSNQRRDPTKWVLLHWRIRLFIKFIQVMLHIQKSESSLMGRHKDRPITDSFTY
tara:strand:+ start:527 stop:1699 length:1173 start_codon:yes stop_codon:yes gene_type:complete